MVWEMASWPDVDSSGAPLTQATSHEDWFYSITQSRTALGVQDGFVAAGYTKYPDVFSTTCRSSCFSEPCPMATISKIGPAGGVEWFEHNNAEGSFWRVIDTSDGGFLAVGHSHDRPLFDYNPVNSIGGIGLSCSPTNEADYRLIIISKYDHAGTREWQYAYGAMDDPDEYLPGIGTQVQTNHDNAWDAVERASGGYRVVGHAVNPNDGMNPQAFVIDIGEDGSVVDRRVFGDTGHRSEFFGIARSDEDYYLVGTQYDAAFDADPYGDVFVIKLGEDLKEEPLAARQLMTTEEEQDTGFDIAIAGDGYPHVAYVENCIAAGRGGCFRLGPGGIGEAFVARLDPEDLSVESQTSLGIVHAHDLFVRLTALSDGGIGFVSTIQLQQPIEPSFTHTDAYVVKLDEEGDVVWRATHDARTSMPHTGTDDLSQECLYDIAEAEDGGLVVAGNNSSNDDDNYVLRFAIEDVPALPAPTVDDSHLVLPSLGLIPNVLAFAGDLVIEVGGKVYVDAGRTLAFGENALLLARDSVVATDATFTESVANYGWSGIVVAEGVSTITGGRVEHATTGVKVYDPARVVIDGTEMAENGTALDVRSNTDGSQPGATVEEAVISGNAIGVRTDYVDCYGTSCNCLTSCRGHVRVLDSVVEENSGTGIYALNGDAEVGNSCVRGNTGHGLIVANALVEPFTGNSVTQNGEEETAVYGAAVLSGGDLRLSPTDDVGENRLVANADAELYVATGGAAFAGYASTSGGNAFVDAGGGTLAYAPSHTTINARHNWWGASPPPSGAFPGPGEVDRTSYLGSDPTTDVCDSPSEFSPRTGAALPESFGGGEPGASLEELRVGIRRLRDSLMADPGAAGAAAVVHALYDLQRVDRSDVLGEREATMSTLGGLRAHLGEHSLPAGLRATAEAALMMEAADALANERYAEARELLSAHAVRVSGETVLRALTLTRAFLEAQAGRREEAFALVADVAAGLQDERERREMTALAATLRDEAPGGSAWPGSASSLASFPGEIGLRVFPNPSAGAVSVRLTLATSATVRMALYDILGRTVAMLADEALREGSHSLRLDGARLPAGLYVVRADVTQEGVPKRSLAARLVIRR